MKVAVVGAGFSGLAATYHLLERGYSVDLFEERQVGAGASGVSSGLMHPYLGEKARRSSRSDEAMAETHRLLKVAQEFSREPVREEGAIVRRITPLQREAFLQHEKDYGDVEFLSEDLVKIHSGIAVHSSNYLKGLYLACLQKGAKSLCKKVHSSCELADYDAFIIAVGAGIFSFPGLEGLKLSATRGQALLCKWPFEPLKDALLGKGHIVPRGEGKVNLGSTYEKKDIGKEPQLEVAFEDLKVKAQKLYPSWEEIEVIEIGAGTRVSRPHDVTPLIHKMGDKGYVLTGMGSRGLLYHGLFAKLLVDML